MRTTQTIKLDLVNPDLQIIHARQGDASSRTLEITLYANGQAIIFSDETVVFKAMKPDGTYVVVEGSTIATTYNKVILTLPGAVTAAKGVVKCELEILDGGVVINTFIFLIKVEPRAVDDGEISEDYFSVLDDLISQATTILESATQQAQNAAGYAQQASDSADEAEAAAASIDIDTINQRLTALESSAETLSQNITDLSNTVSTNYVPNTRTVNGHALSADVSLTPSDITGTVQSSDNVNKTLGMSLSGTTLTITFADVT